MAEPKRCAWAGTDPRMIAYHDEEWGVPVHDDRLLFEFLILEGAQAGLSWQTILNKRDGYREAFADFDPARVARFDRRRVERLLTNAGIVRNRLKIESTVEQCARVSRRRSASIGSFDRFVWSFVGGAPRINRWRSVSRRSRAHAASPTRYRRRSRSAASASSARRSATRSCRRRAWSTITL